MALRVATQTAGEQEYTRVAAFAFDRLLLFLILMVGEILEAHEVAHPRIPPDYSNQWPHEDVEAGPVSDIPLQKQDEFQIVVEGDGEDLSQPRHQSIQREVRREREEVALRSLQARLQVHTRHEEEEETSPRETAPGMEERAMAYSQAQAQAGWVGLHNSSQVVSVLLGGCLKSRVAVRHSLQDLQRHDLSYIVVEQQVVLQIVLKMLGVVS